MSSSPKKSSSGGSHSPFKGVVQLPQARIKTIMKSSPQIEVVGQESLYLITKATELFIMYLSKLAQRHGDNQDEVTYADLSAVAQRKSSMAFLRDILPAKIKMRDYYELMKKAGNPEHDSIF